jgi:hypothetical protein
MSTIWTPSGERPVGRDESTPAPSTAPGPPAGAGPDDEVSDEELAARMAELRDELLNTPASVVVANHCIGLFQLAALHLGQEQPNFEEAQIAIDALAAVVDAVGPRLGENEQPLRDALTNLRFGFTQARNAVSGGGASS